MKFKIVKSNMLIIQSKLLGSRIEGATLYYDQKARKYGVDIADAGFPILNKFFKSYEEAEAFFKVLLSKKAKHKKPFKSYEAAADYYNGLYFGLIRKKIKEVV